MWRAQCAVNNGACIVVLWAELVFVDLLWSPRIDSQAGVPVRQPYLSYQAAKLLRLAKSIPRNRFLCSINVYKYGLRFFSWLTQLVCAASHSEESDTLNRANFARDKKR
jgi:hypothetical protein